MLPSIVSYFLRHRGRHILLGDIKLILAVWVYILNQQAAEAGFVSISVFLNSRFYTVPWKRWSMITRMGHTVTYAQGTWHLYCVGLCQGHTCRWVRSCLHFLTFTLPLPQFCHLRMWRYFTQDQLCEGINQDSLPFLLHLTWERGPKFCQLLFLLEDTGDPKTSLSQLHLLAVMPVFYHSPS